MILFVIIISFILESIISSLIPINTNFFNPCFVVVALIIIYPYFNKYNNRYLITCLITGLIYDFIFTSTLFFFSIIFLILGLIIKFIFSKVSNNIISVNITSFIIIVLYRLIVYFTLLATNYFSFDFNYLLKGIYSSIIMNIIYTSMLYLLTEFISKKLNIKKKYD